MVLRFGSRICESPFSDQKRIARYPVLERPLDELVLRFCQPIFALSFRFTEQNVGMIPCEEVKASGRLGFLPDGAEETLPFKGNVNVLRGELPIGRHIVEEMGASERLDPHPVPS